MRRPTVRRARSLRRRLSLPEALLWRRLRREAVGAHIRRQHPLGRYVLDFYCDAARLCIEVDGAIHGVGDNPAHDEARDAWLAARAVRTLRLPARLVLFEMEAALSAIRSAIAAGPLHHPSGGPPPPEGEDF